MTFTESSPDLLPYMYMYTQSPDSLTINVVHLYMYPKKFQWPPNRVLTVLHVLDLAFSAFSIEYSIRALAVFYTEAFKETFQMATFL